MYSTITWEEFADTYKPIKRKTEAGHDIYPYETGGEEFEFIRSQPAENIWTEVDGEGGCYIINGLHYVNRIQYYVCEVPVTTEKYIEVVCSVDRECDCIDEEGDGDPTCAECEGNGYKTIWVDTREELIEIFGEEYANEQI